MHKKDKLSDPSEEHMGRLNMGIDLSHHSSGVSDFERKTFSDHLIFMLRLIEERVNIYRWS